MRSSKIGEIAGGSGMSRNGVRVIKGRRASGPGLETRGNKITAKSQKSNAKKVIDDSEYKVMDYFSKGNIGKAGRGASPKKVTRNKAVVRAVDKKTPIKINTDPTKPKGIFGALKKKVAAKSPEGRANAKANARGLKAANKPTKASKTFIGDNKKVGVEYRRDLLKNREKPARANRTRLGKNAFPSK